MKKRISILLILVSLLSLILPSAALAQEDAGLQKAISSAKTLLNITETYDKFSYSLYGEEGKTVYHLSWSDSKNILGSIDVSIDSNDRIQSFYSYKPYDERTTLKIPSVSKSDALKIANEFIQKINPSMYKKLQYREENTPLNIRDTNYYFNYTRLEKGIPFFQNYANVSVNNRTGKVESFSCNWMDDLVFPSGWDVISLDKAQKAYMEKLGLKLAYKMSYDEKESAPYLVYTNVYNNKSIDAKTGEVVTPEGYYMGGDMEKAAARPTAQNKADTKLESIPLTPEELKAVENASNFIKQANAEEIGRKVLALDQNFKLESANLYSSGQKGEYSWNMSFRKEEKQQDKTTYENASVSVDAKSGEVVNFYRYSSDDNNGAVKYNKEQVLKIAQDYIKSMQPSKVNDIEYTEWQEYVIKPLNETELPRSYYFTFTRKSNGVYFLDNGFNINVDTVTGKITSYNYSWYKGELPSASKVMTAQEAHKILFESIGLQLQYIADYSNSMDMRKIMPPTEKGVKPQIRIIYGLKPGKPANIDAVSGKLFDYSGEVYKENSIAQYTDIKGHSAENQINILAQFGISLDGNEFKPDQNVAQREFLYLLQKSIDPYITFKLTGLVKDDDDFYNYMIKSGIILESEKAPWSAITKEDAVKFIIRAMKYDKVAEIKGIYNLPFTDKDKIKSELYGYVAIAYGLDIVKADNGYFNPSSLLSRAQAAVTIYNFLNAN